MIILPEIHKLKLNSDFRRAYGRGKSYSDPALVTYVLRNNRAGVCRVGITTGKKIGNAVVRNRCRRVITAALNDIYSDISGGCDIVFVARGKTPYVKSTLVKKEMINHLKKANVLRTEKL